MRARVAIPGRHVALGQLASTDRRRSSVLFAGESGTGKTPAANALAGHLQVPVQRVDLAALANRDIGETAQDLRRADDR